MLGVKGGMKMDADNRVRTTFTRNASTLRFTSVGPNLQNIPRHGGVAAWVKEMFVAPPGHVFWARDYSGIEAVLVGVFASSPSYTRLAQIDVHSFFCAYALYELEKAVTFADLPQLAWSDDDLRECLKGFKNTWKEFRQTLKHVGHLTNYMGGPYKTQEVLLKETGKVVPIGDVKRLTSFYLELFDDIPKWHSSLCQRVDGMKKEEHEDGTTGVCVVRNPYGFPMRFHHVLDWKKVGDQWIWEYGKDAKALVASLPQSTAAHIIAEAMNRLEEQEPDVAATLNLTIHDELLGECQQEEAERCLAVSKRVMEQPIPQIPLDPAWNLGQYLTIYTEGKVGASWGSMSTVA